MRFVGSARDERVAVRRLFDRLGFGARPGDLADALSRGFDAALMSVSTPPADDAGVLATPPPDLGPDPLAGISLADPRRADADLVTTMQLDNTTLWWLDRMVAADSSFTERLTWFWHGHFATGARAVRSAQLMLGQNETMRRLATGDFRDLATAMAVDPAMVIWLNGQENRAGSPNENLGRELMELFTLGVDRYSEADVREAARALTGWRVDRGSAGAYLQAGQHDPGTKTVLGVTGPLDAQSLVALLVDRPESPEFVARRMWFRLVSHQPAPDPVVRRLAGAYGPQRNILDMLRAIAREPAFVDPASSLVKQPVEWLVGLMRAVGLRPSTMPQDSQQALLAGLEAIGQRPFSPPSVGGWPAGNQWLTTATAMARVKLCRVVLADADLDEIKRHRPDVRPGAVAEALGVPEWSPRTADALSRVQDDAVGTVLIAACAPEYVVSG